MTETKTLNRNTPTEKPADEPEQKRFVDLSATQLAGGALAAMTSAVIGARLGVAGTIAGAAIGSIVAGVAGALYTASLKRTKDKITSVIVSRGDDDTTELTTVTDDTVVLDRWQTASLPAATDPQPPLGAADSQALVDEREPLTRRLPWKRILISAVAVFVLAIAGITAFELVSGHAISGGEGTTISQVNEDRSGGSDLPSESSSVTPSQDSTDSSSTSASSEPSASATSETTSSTEASSEPTQSSGSTSSSEPTAGSSQSAVSGESAASTTDSN